MFKAFIQISRQGNVFKATDKIGSKTKTKKAPRKSVPQKASVPRSKSTRKGTLSRSILRSKNAFTQKLQTAKKRPQCMLSLIVDYPIPPEAQGPFFHWATGEFIKRISRLYPHGYMARIYGWSEEAGVHAHIPIRFGVKVKKTMVELQLREIWGDILGSDDERILKLTKPGSEALISYLTSDKKNAELRVLAHRLRGRRLWSIHNGKSIVACDKETLNLTMKEWRVFERILIDLAQKAGLEESTIAQIKKVNTCANYIPAKILKKAFKKFKVWREKQ